MANLRTNNLSGEQGQNAFRGSVNFVNKTETDYLQVSANSDLSLTGDFTIEYWAWISDSETHTRQVSSGNYYTAGKNGNWYFGLSPTSGNVVFYTYDGQSNSQFVNISQTISLNSWHHAAAVRSGNTVTLYLNGISIGSGNVDKDLVDGADGGLQIGRLTVYGSHMGYISNLRILKGQALYTSNFTPPFTELKAIPNTVLLCCQNSDDVTQEETGKTITGNGNLANADFNKSQPKVIPPYGVDAGNVFGGPIQQSGQGYMYFPTGRTEERGRGRVVIAGGTGNSPYTPYMTRIDFFNITTTGNTLLFGDLSFGSRTPKGMVSSTTRAVYAGGMGPSSEVATNSMSFITIATQGNGTDYGDLTAAGRQSEGCSNNTRGIYFSGQNDSPSPGTNNNIIDFITTASTGNATDFGDQTNGRDGGGACQSTTRGIYAGGDPSPYVNIIDFITIATAGNAQDFGDLSFARTGSTGCSNSVRGLFMSGRVAPTNYNTIEFITIATTGNSEDFGDLSYVRIQASAAANKTRGVLIGGNPGSSPYNFTEMSQVTIDSTGNATNFGDCFAARTRASVSDSHGGLS